jgi:hypothetical protein
MSIYLAKHAFACAESVLQYRCSVGAVSVQCRCSVVAACCLVQCQCSVSAVSMQCRCSVVAVLLQRVVVIYWRNAYLFARRVCCSVLQCVAACCSVLHCVSVRCSALQCVAVRCRISESDFSVLHCVAECESVYNLLQCVAVRYSWLH